MIFLYFITIITIVTLSSGELSCLDALHMVMEDVNNKTIGSGDCNGFNCLQEMCNLWNIPNAYLLLVAPESLKSNHINKTDCLGNIHMEMENVNGKIIGSDDCYGFNCAQSMCDLWKLPDAYLLLIVRY